MVSEVTSFRERLKGLPDVGIVKSPFALGLAFIRRAKTCCFQAIR